jgi:tRNA(Ile)-lysidine synthase
MRKRLIFLPMLSDFLATLSSLDLPRGCRVLIAVSGGGDSIALLDLLAAAQSQHGLELIVAHVDHGIHPESGTVATSVERLAGTIGLRCITGRLGLGANASETLARERRYAWLEETRVREGASFIFTAHHADDQAETVLLRLLNGSGPAGLAAMSSRRGAIVRPLLRFTREQLVHYLQERGLSWWEDPANLDPRHLRAWIRSSLLPMIRERVPGVDDSLLRVASQARRERDAWDQVIDALPGLDWKPDDHGGSVAVAPLAGYDSALASAVLRALGRRVGSRIGGDHADRALAFLRKGESGSRLDLGNGWTLELAFDRAHLVWAGTRRTSEREAGKTLTMNGDAGDGAVGRWQLFWRHEGAPVIQERDGLVAWFIPQAFEVRLWAAGDKIHPLGGTGRRLVVRCFQDARVPRHLRDGWPVVIDSAGEIVWVPGVCRSDRLVPRAGVEALRVETQIV